MNYKTWSIIIFAIFLLLFFILGFFKSDATVWMWQLGLPVLVIIQVFIILKAKEQSKKKFGEDEWYEKK